MIRTLGNEEDPDYEQSQEDRQDSVIIWHYLVLSLSFISIREFGRNKQCLCNNSIIY